MTNTQPARGMRDFLPADIRKRNYVIGIIKEVYEKYGFEPLETPSVENLETLTGKYGEEGSQLMFKILKRGEKLQQELAEGKIQTENELSDLALRYDLTVPLARVVANNKNELPKFFKRYQIQPVWRADRPAKGRYREFYQCDVDAIGSSSMIVEAELISAVSEIFQRLGFNDFVIRINHRELLATILELADIPLNLHTDALIALDKIDKIGKNGFISELSSRGIKKEAQIKLIEYLNYFRTNKSSDAIDTKAVQELISIENEITLLQDAQSTLFGKVKFEFKKEGIQDLIQILIYLNKIEFRHNIKIDPSLARGLSYYTGAIMEINVPDLSGSLGGGGRYNNLIAMFSGNFTPAVGFSIGLERILYVMEERGMFPDDLTTNSADVMITLWNEDAAGESLKLAGELRAEGLRVLVYPEADKLGKQFKYADSLNIPFVCILGETELAENKVSIKNLKTGEQETVLRDEISVKLRNSTA